MSCLPTEINTAEPVPAHGDTPVRVGCAPRERSCCFLLSWKFQLCSGTVLRPTPGGRGRSLWQSLELLWRKSLHPKELEDGVCYFRAAQGEALQSSTLPFRHLHSRFVWEVLLCSECKQRAALQGWSRAVFGCYNRIWCPGTCSPGLGSHVQPTVCHMEPTWRMQEEEEKKFGASAKQMPSAGLQEAVWPGNCSWLNWPSGCACLLWPTSTNCCGTLEVPWSSVTGAVSSALQLCGEDLKPHSS